MVEVGDLDGEGLRIVSDQDMLARTQADSALHRRTIPQRCIPIPGRAATEPAPTPAPHIIEAHWAEDSSGIKPSDPGITGTEDIRSRGGRSW
jgi:hypothetical protein